MLRGASHLPLPASWRGCIVLEIEAMIEVSNSRQEPAGWVDNYGNFERVAQDWMEEEPGTTWRPVFFEENPPRDGLTLE